MPNISENAAERTQSHLETMAQEAVKGIIPYPVMITGVNRKTNIGNFENIDLFCAIATPIMALPWDEDFQEAAKAAAEEGFSIASRETGDRYRLLKGDEGR